VLKAWFPLFCCLHCCRSFRCPVFCLIFSCCFVFFPLILLRFAVFSSRRPIKGYEFADVCLVFFKRKSKKIAACILFSDPTTLPQSPLTHTHSQHHPQKSSNPKDLEFLKIEARWLSASSEGLNSYLAPSSGNFDRTKSEPL